MKWLMALNYSRDRVLGPGKELTNSKRAPNKKKPRWTGGAERGFRFLMGGTSVPVWARNLVMAREKPSQRNNYHN